MNVLRSKHETAKEMNNKGSFVTTRSLSFFLCEHKPLNPLRLKYLTLMRIVTLLMWRVC